MIIDLSWPPKNHLLAIKGTDRTYCFPLSSHHNRLTNCPRVLIVIPTQDGRGVVDYPKILLCNEDTNMKRYLFMKGRICD